MYTKYFQTSVTYDQIRASRKALNYKGTSAQIMNDILSSSGTTLDEITKDQEERTSILLKLRHSVSRVVVRISANVLKYKVLKYNCMIY